MRFPRLLGVLCDTTIVVLCIVAGVRGFSPGGSRPGDYTGDSFILILFAITNLNLLATRFLILRSSHSTEEKGRFNSQGTDCD